MYVLQQAGLLRQDLVFTFIFWRFGFTSIPCIDGCFVVVVVVVVVVVLDKLELDFCLKNLSLVIKDQSINQSLFLTIVVTFVYCSKCC